MSEFFDLLDEDEPLLPFNSSVTLLSETEQRMIQQSGLPSALTETWQLSEANGKLIWSLKALQSIRAACSFHKVAEPFSKVSTKIELSDWLIDFYATKIRNRQFRIAHEHDAGNTPVELRALTNAYLFGDLKEYSIALNQTAALPAGVVLLHKK